MLAGIKRGRKRIAAYGAAAKGAILLNYLGAGRETIDFVVDRNVHKQGWFMPGVKLPIHDPEKLLSDMPDFVLLLPWNIKDEILSQQEPYRRRGGSFIIPIPAPQILPPLGEPQREGSGLALQTNSNALGHPQGQSASLRGAKGQYPRSTQEPAA